MNLIRNILVILIILLVPATSYAQLSSADLYKSQGIVAYKRGQHAQALELLNKAIDLNPKDPQTLVARAMARFDLTGKVDDIKRAISIDPNYAQSYQYRAMIYYSQGKLTKALADLKTALKKNNSIPALHRLQGHCYLTQKNTAAAFTSYTRAIELDPQDAEALFWRGIIFFSQQDLKSAYQDFFKAHQILPKDFQILFNMAKILALSGDYKEALHTFNQLEHMDSSDPNLILYFCYCYYKLGYFDELEKLFTKLSQDDVLLPQNLFALSTLSFLFGDTQEAFNHINVLLDWRHNSPGAYYNRALYFFSRGNFPAAKQDLLTYLKKYNAHDWEALLFLFETEKSLGLSDLPFTFLKKMPALPSYKKRLASKVIDLLLHYKQYEKLILYLNEAFKHNSPSLSLQFHYAYAHSKLGKSDKALEIYTNILDTFPLDTASLYNRANIFYSQNKLHEALSDYDKVLLINPSFSMAYYNRAIVKEDLGDREGANRDRTNYDKAKKRNSHSS